MPIVLEILALNAVMPMNLLQENPPLFIMSLIPMIRFFWGADWLDRLVPDCSSHLRKKCGKTAILKMLSC
jgi:hypothetical protein